MTTFLKLCQDTSRECALAGGDTVPTTVVGQVGELQKIVNHVIQSYNEIQQLHNNWRWMRRGFNFPTVSGTDTYAYDAAGVVDDITSAAITRFREWRIDDYDDPPKFYLTSAGVGSEGWMIFYEWNDFKFQFKIGTQNDSAPSIITINPQNEIVLGAQPNDIYTISGDYQLANQILDITDGTDSPDMPSDYHDLVMWGAVMKYGIGKAAPEIVTKGQYYYGKLLGELENNQLAPIEIAGPMV
jgi:hypothetical protein